MQLNSNKTEASVPIPESCINRSSKSTAVMLSELKQGKGPGMFSTPDPGLTELQVKPPSKSTKGHQRCYQDSWQCVEQEKELD